MKVAKQQIEAWVTSIGDHVSLELEASCSAIADMVPIGVPMVDGLRVYAAKLQAVADQAHRVAAEFDRAAARCLILADVEGEALDEGDATAEASR